MKDKFKTNQVVKKKTTKRVVKNTGTPVRLNRIIEEQKNAFEEYKNEDAIMSSGLIFDPENGSSGINSGINGGGGISGSFYTNSGNYPHAVPKGDIYTVSVYEEGYERGYECGINEITLSDKIIWVLTAVNVAILISLILK